MGVNDKISEHFQLTVENSTSRILADLSNRKQQQTWTDFILSDQIDFKGIEVKDNRLEILRIPTVLNPFKAHGRITFDLSDSDNNTVTVKCRILPQDGIFPYVIIFYFVFFTLWTIACFLIAWGDLKVLLLVIPGWTVFGLVIYFGLLYTKSGLRNYARRIVKELMTEKKASR